MVEHYTDKKNDEKCESCGFVRTEDVDLVWKGYDISGHYPICPKCNDPWEYKEINVVETKMVRITLEEYNKLVNNDNK